MLTEPMVNRQGHVSYGEDKDCFVRFHKKPYKGKSLDYIEIIFPGARDVTDRKVKEEDKQRFMGQWDAYQKGEQFKQEGYPLENWIEMDVGMVREYNHNHIYTIEQLAGVTESNLDNLGLGARTLHTKAKAFLEANKDTKLAVKLQAQNEALEKQVSDLSKVVSDLKAQIEKKPKKGK